VGEETEGEERGDVQGEVKPPLVYIEEISVLIRRKTYGSALRIAKDAMAHYPEDPFVLSFYGLLASVVLKRHKDGINACKKSLKAIKKSDYDTNSAYPTLYLNFGRVYLASGDKGNAFDTFHKGLARDRRNKDLIWELKKLGIRRPPVIPFLPRSFFVNRYLGKLRHWILTR
jgi:tetratricopeptide (TPR) repeat protein